MSIINLSVHNKTPDIKDCDICYVTKKYDQILSQQKLKKEKKALFCPSQSIPLSPPQAITDLLQANIKFSLYL